MSGWCQRRVTRLVPTVTPMVTTKVCRGTSLNAHVQPSCRWTRRTHSCQLRTGNSNNMISSVTQKGIGGVLQIEVLKLYKIKVTGETNCMCRCGYGSSVWSSSGCVSLCKTVSAVIFQNHNHTKPELLLQSSLSHDQSLKPPPLPTPPKVS